MHVLHDDMGCLTPKSSDAVEVTMSYTCIWLFRLVNTVVTEMGGLHIAVNNAGMLRWSAAEDTNRAEWDATFELNSKSVFICCQVRPVLAKHQLLTGLTVDP